MALRYTITSKTVNPDQTLTIACTLAWTDETGSVVWSDNRQRTYQPGVTVAQVVSDVRADAINAAPLIQASVGLNAHTYELQSGQWVQVS